jgi:uncharacterized protein (TIGR00251 family)
MFDAPPDFSMNLQQKGNVLLLAVKVVPNASRAAIAGLLGDRLKVKVAQPPEDGKANRAVEDLLATTLGLPSSHVQVVAGHTRPQKTVQITGLPLETARTLLLAASR